MKKLMTVCLAVTMILAVSGVANAALAVIGTATDSAGSYNMVWENDDTDGTSLVWLDMTTSNTWQGAMDWAAGLDSTMTYNVDPGYSVAFSDTQWRLPECEDRITTLGMAYGTAPGNTHSFGYYIPGEAEHLYRSGGLTTFENLNTTYIGNWLATTTDYPMRDDTGLFNSPDSDPGAYYYNIGNGNLALQRLDPRFGNPSKYTLAVRSADITVVPEPATMCLLGLGGLMLRRRKRA
jgi:hypothetical protein